MSLREQLKNGNDEKVFVGYNDLMIGATAVYHKMTVVTSNLKHFQRIPNIKIEDWCNEDNGFPMMLNEDEVVYNKRNDG